MNIYFTSTEKADQNLEIISALQTWAADVVSPNQIIGWYGLSGNTVPAMYGHYRSLIANYNRHAFFRLRIPLRIVLMIGRRSLILLLA